MSDQKQEPPPGSPEAEERGCICPIMDNAYGRGIMGIPGRYVIVEGCPLHDKERQGHD